MQKKISDEKVSGLNLEGMEMTASEYAVEMGGGIAEFPDRKI